MTQTHGKQNGETVAWTSAAALSPEKKKALLDAYDNLPDWVQDNVAREASRLQNQCGISGDLAFLTAMTQQTEGHG